MECKKVTILGSTGSVGMNTVSLIEAGGDTYKVSALTANTNVSLLAQQALKLKPELAVIADESLYIQLKNLLDGTSIEIAAGPEALIQAASVPADWIMAAIVGAAGLLPTLAAIKQGTVVAIANKEVLVCAGEIIISESLNCGTTLLPVDSEHNAIFQVFDFNNQKSVDKILLTASGGPFASLSLDQMKNVTPEEAMDHPNWDMGNKISIDSATMMNKGLELIEAYHLFGIRETNIDILIHPQSVVHSLVTYIDGSVLAQLGTPDMRTPIAYTLSWPNRISVPVPKLDLAAIAKLTFEAPDTIRFPALSLSREALKSGGSTPTILNAANEVAVEAFMRKRIGFLDICRIVGETLSKTTTQKLDTIDDVFSSDTLARQTALDLVKQ